MNNSQVHESEEILNCLNNNSKDINLQRETAIEYTKQNSY